MCVHAYRAPLPPRTRVETRHRPRIAFPGTAPPPPSSPFSPSFPRSFISTAVPAPSDRPAPLLPERRRQPLSGRQRSAAPRDLRWPRERSSATVLAISAGWGCPGAGRHPPEASACRQLRCPVGPGAGPSPASLWSSCPVFHLAPRAPP